MPIRAIFALLIGVLAPAPCLAAVASTRPVPPPSTLETVVGAVSRVIWPVAILLFITTHMGFFPLIVIAIVANMVLGSIRRSLRQRRFAALPPDPPTYPSAPSQPDDLR